MNINIIEDKHNRLLANFEDSGAEILQYAKVYLSSIGFETDDFDDHPKQRVLVMVPEEGQEFEIEVWDIEVGVAGRVLGTTAVYEFIESGVIHEGSTCYLLDDSYNVIDSTVTEDGGGFTTAVFDDSSYVGTYSKIGFKQVIKGVKGFICCPVLLDVVLVLQTTGDREVEIYLFEEEGE